MAWLPFHNGRCLVSCTSYSEVREYDTRGPRKPTIDKKVFGGNEKDIRAKKAVRLVRILPSKMNENHVYVVT